MSMIRSALRLGTRGSQLALAQSSSVSNLLATKVGETIEQVIIRTDGDDTSLPLSQIGRPGIFVSALRDALLANRVDFIVHSFKDLPTGVCEGIDLAAVLPREDPRDVLISATGAKLDQLAPRAIVGTSSPRRSEQLKSFRPDLIVKEIRGNVDTRISKVHRGEFDAVILAAAGLNRLSRQQEIVEYLDMNIFIPAPAQGALVVECRADDRDLALRLRKLDHLPTRLTSVAERAILEGISATCQTALGSYACFTAPSGTTLHLIADLAGVNTVGYVQIEMSSSKPIVDEDSAREFGLAGGALLLSGNAKRKIKK